ncbi:Transposon Ty3-G Gag-Pol polyprotein [Vitis vinifera]|uniref:Transposon Ty3-G Gag-Pol polyprotein n=1 Tax=Vitis vinifera TaxID=29760 RepID=A0A438CGS3_VITVI|nr:Transposon Ty3-G Gag-Pol polyprotein [Vitis vinifera]
MEVPDSMVKILKEFKDVMHVELLKKLPPRRPIDHKIELLPGAKPPAQVPYRMSPAELLEPRKRLRELLDTGLIQPSRAPYDAPVLFQKKHDGSLPICVDYRALNKVTIKNKYLIPLAAELFDRLSKATYFTKLDLRLGYWQVWIATRDEGKTTYVTRELRLHVKPKKFEFAQKDITFLGHKINAGLIKMDEGKVQAIKEWSVPSKMTELQSFLGLANYYRRFIKGYSNMVSSLTILLKKDNQWDWSSVCEILSGLSDGQDREEEGCRIAAAPPHSIKTLGEHFHGFHHQISKGRFWVEFKFFTRNHPQTNGKTKRINVLLEEYLRHYVGDKVLLKLAPQIWNKINSKKRQRGLIPNYDGPFEVIKRVGHVAYMLKLLERLKLHPTFHVSFLKPYHEDLDAERVQIRRIPSLVMKSFDREVDKILDHRTMGHSRKNRRTDFLVQWKETSETKATWERDVSL